MTHTHNIQENHRRRLSVSVSGVAFVIGIAVACGTLCAPHTARAQASAGITGTITDPSGAVVPNAQVTVTNEDTSVANKTVTGSAGTYSFKGLNPGRYRVAVEASGFKLAVQADVTVEVSTTATIDVQVTTGSTSETVQVTADQIALNTTAPELGSTIEPVVVAALPVEVAGRGRQVDQLQFMAQGPRAAPFPTA